MKHVKKDQPRQERRRRTLARLEKYLAGGVKDVNKGKSPSPELVPFTETDIAYIKKNIAILKERVGGAIVS